MAIYTEISFRDMEPSPAVEVLVHKHVRKLESSFNNITACRITVEAPHKHRLRGNLFNVRIDIAVPQAEVVSTRDAGVNVAHEQVSVAIRDAFTAVRRRLTRHKAKLRIDHHIPAALPTGVLKKISHIDDFGIIETSDGREIYLHRNSLVTGNFDKLKTGDILRFNEELGEKGPQASSAHWNGRHSVKQIEPNASEDAV
ncbi:MAG: hypothetical protein RJB13_939 [Pseudomonadota bacterium]